MKTQISILGIQPLNYSDKTRESIFTKFISYKFEIPCDYPDWMAELERFYPNKHYHSGLLHHEENITLLDDRAFTFSAYLLGSTRLNLFVIVYELRSIEAEEVRLDTNQIRRLFVMSDNDCRLAAIKSSSNKALELVAMMMNINSDDVIIDNDTCNVAVFFNPFDKIPLNSENCYMFVGDDDAERLTVCREELPISDRTMILFGGRVHLVISISDNDVYIIKNVLCNLQFMWFFVPIYLRLASRLHLDIISNKNKFNASQLEEESINLSYIAQTVKLKNESQKLSYEIFTKKFYDRVEDSWGIEKSITQFENYASFFESFIKNLRDKQSQKADDILSYVLAALAIFGAVGFWTDILHAEFITREWRNFALFERDSTDSIFGLTTITLAIISILIAIGVIYYSITTKYGRRKRKRD